MMRHILTLILFFISITSLFAQTPDTLWTRILGDDGSEYANSIDQTDDGGFIIFGRSFPHDQAMLLKVDSMGNAEWTQIYGEVEGNDYFNSGFQTDDGGYICAGTTELESAGGEDFWLVKTDHTGEITWSRLYGGIHEDICNSIQPTSDGGYIMAGSSNTSANLTTDWWLVKTDAAGNEEWNQLSNYPEIDTANDVKETSDGGYVLTGGKTPQGHYFTDFFVSKTDSQGSIEWTYESGQGLQNEYGNSVIQTSDGGYAALGYVSTGFNDIYLVKLDANGNEEWTRTFGGDTYADYGYCLHQTADDGFILTCSAASFGISFMDAWILKTDSTGQIEWDQLIGGTANEYGSKIIITENNEYLMAGTSNSFGNGNYDIWLVRLQGEITPRPFELITPTNSQMLHTSTVNFSWTNSGSFFPQFSVVYDLYVTMSMADWDTTVVYNGLTHNSLPLTVEDLTGLEEWSQMLTGNWYVDAIAGPDTTRCDSDFLFRISALSETDEDLRSGIPEEFSINSIYPNPFNSSTTISVALPQKSELRLSVYNIVGQEVALLVNDTVDAGYHGIVFKAESLTSGVYFILASMNMDKSLIKKIVYVN